MGRGSGTTLAFGWCVGVEQYWWNSLSLSVNKNFEGILIKTIREVEVRMKVVNCCIV